MPTARWNLVVSQETDDAPRRVLAAEGRAEAEVADAVDEALGWARRHR